MKRIAVLMGGKSQEYDVSISSGTNICFFLDKAKYEVFPCIINKKGEWIPSSTSANDCQSIEEVSILIKELQEQAGFLLEDGLRFFREKQIEVAFLALHGPYGEDGCIQGLLEVINIPYTGSNVSASALAIDKIQFKNTIRAHQLLYANYKVILEKEWKQQSINHQTILQEIGLPCVCKSPKLGSSVGLGIIYEEKELSPFIESLFRYDEIIMVEQYIKGREITCGVLQVQGELKALPLIEIIPKERKYFDYHSKYIAGATNEICPAPVDDDITKRAQEIARTTHQIIGCGDVSRTDMIVDDKQNIYVLEINTIPGMTKTSLLPQAAEVFGLSFSQLTDTIIKNALWRYNNKKQYLEIQ